MLAQATLLSLVGVPANMLWQTIIGLHLLVPYGLFEYSSRYRPNSFFTYTSATLEAILADNPSLNSETANLVRGSNPYPDLQYCSGRNGCPTSPFCTGTVDQYLHRRYEHATGRR